MSDPANDTDARLARIEMKLDALLAALADEQDDQPQLSLDGEAAGRERDQTQSLG